MKQIEHFPIAPNPGSSTKNMSVFENLWGKWQADNHMSYFYYDIVVVDDNRL